MAYPRIFRDLDRAFDHWVRLRDGHLEQDHDEGQLFEEFSSYNLRSLLVIVAFVAVLLAWHTDKRRWQAQLREERAARELAEGELDYLQRSQPALPRQPWGSGPPPWLGSPSP